jgi:hypothetical protein
MNGIFRNSAQTLLEKAVADATISLNNVEVFVSAETNPNGDGSTDIVGNYTYLGKTAGDQVAHYQKEDVVDSNPLDACLRYVRRYAPGAVLSKDKIIISPSTKR